jgi:predicted nucleic acid-binding protein
MRKLKIYLETSVISHLDQQDVPDKMNDTLILWEEIKAGKYDVFLSERVISEIMDSNEQKMSCMLEYISQIDYVVLEADNNVMEYAKTLTSESIMTENHFDDCLHIAYAVVNDCDMILSWNFRHIVRAKTINGVRYISSLLGYRDIGIYAPSMII